MFPVSFSSGFIHVRKDKWYIACGYAYDWALEACESELGSSKFVKLNYLFQIFFALLLIFISFMKTNFYDLKYKKREVRQFF